MLFFDSGFHLCDNVLWKSARHSIITQSSSISEVFTQQWIVTGFRHTACVGKCERRTESTCMSLSQYWCGCSPRVCSFQVRRGLDAIEQQTYLKEFNSCRYCIQLINLILSNSFLHGFSSKQASTSSKIALHAMNSMLHCCCRSACQFRSVKWNK